MVGRPRFERGTNGLKVRCSTSWANDPEQGVRKSIRWKFKKEIFKAFEPEQVCKIRFYNKDGGSSAIRTRDQRINSPLLYQLS